MKLHQMPKVVEILESFQKIELVLLVIHEHIVSRRCQQRNNILILANFKSSESFQCVFFLESCIGIVMTLAISGTRILFIYCTDVF